MNTSPTDELASPVPALQLSTVDDARRETRIHILLPVHNRRELTEKFARCLQQQTHRNFHLLLIDDGSTDGTAEAICSMLPDVTVIRGTGNWWWGGSLDKGIRWLVEHDIDEEALILFINDDLTVEADYLARAVPVMHSRADTFVLSQMRGADGSTQETGTHADLDRLAFTVAARPDQINCLATQGLFAWWKTVKTVGGFHPMLLPHYLSDYEYTIRAGKLGYRLETSAALLIDLNRETTGYHQISEQNFLRFLRKFLSIKSPAHPVYWSSFILLTCPTSLWPRHLFILWMNSLMLIAIEFYRSCKRLFTCYRVKS